MRTLKTDKGIEFDVEFKNVWRSPSRPKNEIEYEVTCNEGSLIFEHSYKHYGEWDVSDEEAEQILFDDCDFQQAKDWVDSVEIESIFEELRALVIKGEILGFTADFEDGILLIVRSKDGNRATMKNVDDIDTFFYQAKKGSKND